MVRMRTTKGKRNMRRSHHVASTPTCTTDTEGHVHIRHHVSRESGQYRSRPFLSLERQQDRAKKREEQRASRNVTESGDEKRTTEQASLGP